MRERDLREFTYNATGKNWLASLSDFFGTPTYTSEKDPTVEGTDFLVQYEIVREGEFRRNPELQKESLTILIGKDLTGLHHFRISIYVEKDATNMRFTHVTKFVIDTPNEKIDFYCFDETVQERYLLSVFRTGEIKKNAAAM